MKKVITFLLTIGAFTSFGQEIKINVLGDPTEVSGTTIEVNNNEALPKKEFDVINTGDATIEDVSVRRTRVEEIEGTEDYLCWDAACYPAAYVSASNPFVSPVTDRLDLVPGDTLLFSSYHVTNDLGGTVLYRYEFLDAGNEVISTIDIRYTGSLNVEENQDLNLSVYPNPAIDLLNVAVDLSGNENEYSFKLYSVLGNEVVNKTLINGTNKLDIAEMPNGVYFYSVVRNSNVIETKKLVIKH